MNNDPNFLAAHYKLWYVYSVMGDRAQSAQEFQWVIRSISDPALQRSVQNAFQNNGYIAALGAVANDGGGTNDYGSPVDSARSWSSPGTGTAIGLLQHAYQIHDGWVIFVPTDPAFSSLRSDSRFESIVQGIGKKE